MKATVTRKVNSRLEANTASKKLIPLDIGASVNLVDFKFGENFRGNSLWYVDDKGIHYTALAISLVIKENRLSSLIDFSKLWNIAKNRIIKIGIYDSGVTKSNDLFNERVIQLNHTNSTITEHHGDYMATIIAGSDLKNGYIGFLPNAQIYSFKADTNSDGLAIITPDCFIEALNSFLEKDVDIVNISMTTTILKDFFERDPRIKDLLDEFNKKSIPLITSAGNQGDISDKGDDYYPAKLDNFFAVSGYILENSTIDFDFSLNLWSGIKLLSPSFPVYPLDFFENLQITKTAGSSVSCAVTVGIFGILKCYFENSDLKNSIAFKDYINSTIASLPDWKTDPAFIEISTKSFKYLDFNLLIKILNLDL